MKTSDFFFELPEGLIAQYPPEKRGQSRLMLLNRRTGERSHRMVEDLPEILCGPEFRGKDGGLPLLVFNNSKVRKARLIGISQETGAKAEFLLVEKIGTGDWGLGSGVCFGQQANREITYNIFQKKTEPRTPNPEPHSIWKALVQRAKRRRTGSVYVFFDDNGAEIARAEIIGGEGEFKHLAFDRVVDDDWLDRYGHIPLPPYIKRQDAPSDSERYQTVYASACGSSAAPTAGLHFTNELLERIGAAGIESVFITLHVGLGTFLPVRSENIEDHVMHREIFNIDDNTAIKIEEAKTQGRKVIAVGTTSVRTMESAWKDGALKRGEGATSIFIYPGYRFNTADALFTNFHTPESTLLMLVSAFAGRELILESYAEAVARGYRFFSYGDAMLII
ncbi:MAG: tRNA preQ1(34) S-adenosylmethionine ribosyltransferase-isomerase QueA [Treponema sp.]|jgi:S-adenosylmethionine:tRNA ribosyltransferase-isomerase|nr:tRNA preQ1(34) S-adenosylmethionine ribosyltransferase-isomerase QueA [Treponema sp.]